MKTDIFIISSNSYLEYILVNCQASYNIFYIQSIQEFYNSFKSSIIPIIICDDLESFLHFKTTCFGEMLILTSSLSNLKWKYQIEKPLRISHLLSLVRSLSYKKIFKINDSILFFYHHAELVTNNSTKLSLTSIEADILNIILSESENNPQSFFTKIWPFFPLDQAHKHLHNYIYKLKRKLESFDLTIHHSHGTYQIIELSDN